MKLKYIQAFLFILSVVTISCRKDAGYVRAPEFKQKIVVEAYISPDQDSNFIYISSTENRFGELTGIPPSIGNLDVYLSDGTKEFKLDTIHIYPNYFNAKGYFIKDMPVSEGKTYHIKVSSDLGLTAEAECTVPVKRDFKLAVDTNSVITHDDYGFKISIKYIDFSITDFPGEKNFYRLLYTYQEYWPKYIYPWKSLQKTLMAEVPISSVSQPDVNDKVFNDIGRDGKKFVLRTIELQPVYLGEDNSTYKADSAIIHVYLLNTDKPYYDFHNSLLNYSLGDSPFSEPSFFYSNIKDGVGIFAAYTIDSLRFRIK